MFSDTDKPAVLRALVLFMILFVIPIGVHGGSLSPIVEADFLFSIPGLTEPVYGNLGYSINVSHEIWNTEFSSLDVGLMHSSAFYSLQGATAFGGDSGFSWETGIYGLADQVFYPFPGRRFYVGVAIYFGWNRLSIKGEVDRPYLSGDGRYEDTSHFFNWGPILKVGYMVNRRVGIHGIVRASFRGLTDGDGSSLFSGDIGGPDTRIYAGVGCRLRTASGD